MEKPEQKLQYICHYILRTTHAQIRQYEVSGLGRSKRFKLLHYYGDSAPDDPVESDEEFAGQLVRAGVEEYPVIYVEKYPVHYAVIVKDSVCVVIGPVNVEQQQVYHEGMTIENYIARRHGVEKLQIPYCEYEKFCRETLLLFYFLTGIEMTYDELNEKNFITEDLLASMRENKSKLFFNYHEDEVLKKHNPYDREARMMEGIRKGDVERVINSLDETFVGEYGVLSRNSLQSAKNLGIVGLAIAVRAAIEGGMPYEEAFSLNDSQILKIDGMNSIGEIEVMVRRSKIQYAEIVRDLKHNKDRKKNPIVEECKNLIFRKMHSKIVVRELADELNVSLEYLSALFRKNEGITISDYIVKEKILRSENLLTYSDYSIGQIAVYLGFSSQSHFGTMFKKYENMTPKEYRDRYHKKEIWGND